MNLRVENQEISLEFPLTQPKRAWKIRKANGKKTSPKFEYRIEEGDKFEWMITIEELRDMVSAMRCLFPDNYKEAKDRVDRITLFNSHFSEIIGEDISLDAMELGKQRKPEEKTPYLFVLISLDRMDEHYLIDKRGKKISKPIGHQIRAGDKLVWHIKQNQIAGIAVKLASLDEGHKEMVQEQVFKRLEDKI